MVWFIKEIPPEKLEAWFNDSREKHNGHGFVDFVSDMKHEKPKTKIMKDFNISRAFLYKAILPAYEKLVERDDIRVR